jgi:chromosome segregation ATPase
LVLFFNVLSELRSKVSELEQHLQSQEKDARMQSGRLQELQGQLDQARRDLTDRDKTLGKSRDELSKATTQHEQAIAKVGDIWRIQKLQ